jgi:hypothetical protein
MLQLGAGHGWMVQTDDGNVGRAVMVAFHDASHRRGNFLDIDRRLDETALEGVTMLRQDYPELRSRQAEKRRVVMKNSSVAREPSTQCLTH